MFNDIPAAIVVQPSVCIVTVFLTSVATFADVQKRAET